MFRRQGGFYIDTNLHAGRSLRLHRLDKRGGHIYMRQSTAHRTEGEVRLGEYFPPDAVPPCEMLPKGRGTSNLVSDTCKKSPCIATIPHSTAADIGSPSDKRCLRARVRRITEQGTRLVGLRRSLDVAHRAIWDPHSLALMLCNVSPVGEHHSSSPSPHTLCANTPPGEVSRGQDHDGHP